MTTKRYIHDVFRTKVRSPDIPPGGFSLIELMIALTLGILIIGAVITVFVSGKSSYNIKREFDDTQDAFRFTSHVLTRLMQSSESIIDPDSGDNVLRISLEGGDGIFDCLGSEVPTGDSRTNEFTVVDNEFVCDPDIDDADRPATALTSGVSSVQFLYADVLDDVAPMVSDFKTRAEISDPDPDNWFNVRSVRTQLELTNGYAITFTATSRGQAIGNSVSAL
jgi:type II secretory pathway pseudopilin PulG